MRQRIHSQLILPLLTAVVSVSAVRAQELDQRIDSYLTERVAKEGIPGLTAAVVLDGRVAYIGAFGVRRLGEEELLTPDHIFHFASVSKPFVATAVLQLEERGKLRLDDPVVRYLPYFRLGDEQYRQITIRQMLNHTSGMPDVLDYEWGSPEMDDGAAERYVRGISSEKLLFMPGQGWRYSNMAFDVLGDLISKVSGMSFEEFIAANILRPIGMVRSSFFFPEIDPALRTIGHVGRPPRVSGVYPYNRAHAPSSTLNSNVREMTRWLLVNLNRGVLDGRRILGQERYDLMWTPTTDTTEGDLKVGLSWAINELRGHRVVSHGGRDTGFRSCVLLLPDDGIGVVLASNWEETDARAIAYAIADQVLVATAR